jgi:hypothetical protein
MGKRLPAVALGAIGAGACAIAAFTTKIGNDYPGPPAQGSDFAGPPIAALAGGHVQRFFDSQPMMGPVTLILRAPVVALVRAFGGSQLSQYQLGCLVCLGLVAVMALAFLRPVLRERHTFALCGLALALVLAGPLTLKALEWGHPEELVGAALCVAALVLASRGRPLAAGVTLGLAIATKQWALLAFLPALFVAPRGRTTIAAATVGTAAALLLPMLLGNPHLFVYQNVHAGMVTGPGRFVIVTVTNVFLPYSRVIGEADNSTRTVLIHGIPTWVGQLSHPAVFAIAAALPLSLWTQRRQWSLEDGLLVLAVLFLVRCLLDPLTISYHHVPLFVTIVAYEVVRRRTVPVVALISAAWTFGLIEWVDAGTQPVLFNRLYLVWALGLLFYLGLEIRASWRRPAESDAAVVPPGAALAA